jgi:hypothetical protein
MYGLLPGMKKRPLLGDQGEGTWNAKFYREFDMTNDRDLWTKPNGKLWTPKEICGLNWPEDMSIPFSEVRAAMAENGFWPLYEGKHMDQYLIDTKPIDKWVDLEKAKNKNGVYPRSSVKIVFRAVARNTDERTFIVSILPLKSCFGNSCWGAEMPNCDATILMTILNSFVTDYATRFRVSANMNFTHAGKIAVLSPDQCSGMSTIETRSVSNLTINNVADDKDLWSLLWDANKSMALAYGLNAGDFEHIFSAFPVFARKRPKFFAYLQEKIKEWKEE